MPVHSAAHRNSKSVPGSIGAMRFKQRGAPGAVLRPAQGSSHWISGLRTAAQYVPNTCHAFRDEVGAASGAAACSRLVVLDFRAENCPKSGLAKGIAARSRCFLSLQRCAGPTKTHLFPCRLCEAARRELAVVMRRPTKGKLRRRTREQADEGESRREGADGEVGCPVSAPQLL